MLSHINKSGISNGMQFHLIRRGVGFKESPFTLLFLNLSSFMGFPNIGAEDSFLPLWFKVLEFKPLGRF